MITHPHIQHFFTIACILDGIPANCFYVDERIIHRVHNLCMGLSGYYIPEWPIYYMPELKDHGRYFGCKS